MLDPIVNFGKVTVPLGSTNSATSVALTAGHGARLPAAQTADPTSYFNLVWYDANTYLDPADDPNREIVRVTNRTTDALTVTRGQEGITATTKTTNTTMFLALTKQTYDKLAVSDPSTVTGATSALPNSLYVANHATIRVVITLPTVCAVGNVIEVLGKGAGGWQIAQPAVTNYRIYFGTSATSTSSAGSLASSATRDSVRLVCITANLEWQVSPGPQGILTVV